MSAFILFHLTVTDPEKFGQYAKAVPATLAEFGGKVFIRGKVEKVFKGQHDNKVLAILKFPDQTQATGWYESEAYQALIAIRDEAANVTTVIGYTEPQN